MKEIHNPVFDIVPAPADKSPYAWSVKFKGKKYHEEILSFYGEGAYVDMSPEKFLDFDAAYLPRGFDYYVDFPPTQCMKALDGVTLSRKKKSFTMCFCFSLSRQHFKKMYLNPLKVLEQFTEAAAEIGYHAEIGKGVDDSVEESCLYVEPKTPVEGNLYDFYQKHVAVFEDLLQQAQREVLVRIRKELVK